MSKEQPSKKYTKNGVRGLRKYRKTIKSPFNGVSDEDYQAALGDLLGAGHLTITGLVSHEVESHKFVDSESFEEKIEHEHTIKFRTRHNHTGDDPHIRGYLQSSHPNDPTYRIKGWLNLDENSKFDSGRTTIRIELVNPQQ